MENYNIITFNSTHTAIFAEKSVKETSMSGRLIPIPSQISSGCGLCLKIEQNITSQVLNILNCNDIEIGGVYSILKNGLNKTVTQIL